MTTEEKLQHFYEVCMEDAKAQYQAQTADYEAALSAAFEAHQAEVRERQAQKLSAERETVKREMRRSISREQQRFRHELSEKQTEYQEKLFSEAAEKLAAFRKTEAYLRLLEKQITEIRALSGGADYIIYLDAGDAALLDRLPAGVQLSKEPFSGGTVGVIASKHMVVDNSFRTKLREEQQHFYFAAGGAEENV